MHRGEYVGIDADPPQVRLVRRLRRLHRSPREEPPVPKPTLLERHLQARHRARDGPRVLEHSPHDRLPRNVAGCVVRASQLSRGFRAVQELARQRPHRVRAVLRVHHLAHRQRPRQSPFGGDGPAEEPEGGGPDALARARDAKIVLVHHRAPHVPPSGQQLANVSSSRSARARAAAAVARGPVARGAHVERHPRGDAGEAAALEEVVPQQTALEEHEVPRAVRRDQREDVVEIRRVRGDVDGSAARGKGRRSPGHEGVSHAEGLAHLADRRPDPSAPDDCDRVRAGG
mmetsp:Transcript_8546/g.34519  ORF Transcript_8546/g.34519 Transcript_8546/m.34519 type:complete len:287 (+) Transcript_8546:1168-2028(+)